MATLHQVIQQRAAALLGVVHSHNAGRENKCGILLSQFVEGAVDEVYLACNWPFGIHTNTQSQLAALDANRIDDNHVEVFTEPYARLIAIAPSSTNWSLTNGNLSFKISRALTGHQDPMVQDKLTDLCPTNEIPDLIVGYKMHCNAKENNHHFVNLAAQCLAAQISYSLYSDSVYSDAARKQYLAALKDAQTLYDYQLNIDNASKVI